MKQTEARSGPVTAGGIDEVYDENYDYDSLVRNLSFTFERLF